jgi:hypothetical protein
MTIRRWAIALGLGACLSTSLSSVRVTAQTAPPTFDTAPLEKQKEKAIAPAKFETVADIEAVFQQPSRWPIYGAYGVGLAILLVGFQQYRARRHWLRVNDARRAFMEFKQRPGVQTVMSILDFEEYQTNYYTDPLTQEVKPIEASDSRLRRSLQEHAAMVKIKSALMAGVHHYGLSYRDPKHEPTDHAYYIDADTCKRYEEEEFPAEVTLRNWFDEFLTGLEEIEAMIQGGLFSARDIKPFIHYWIKVIADRTVRRKGGASFYDPLFYYIRYAGYTGVESLFERYGYKILPPPYVTHDFEYDPDIKTVSFKDCDTYRALCCAKASMLVYADTRYMRDIVALWLKEDDEENYRHQSDEAFLASVIYDWHHEYGTDDVKIDDKFESFEHEETDTQAFIFRKHDPVHKKDHIILVFRGTEKLKDWRTNFSLTMRKLPTTAYRKTGMPSLTSASAGKVHRGFLNALKSIEPQIMDRLDLWGAKLPSSKDPDAKRKIDNTPEVWVTGHSLGGALAAIAAVSLKYQGYNIAGLYTFGQPRVGDWSFGRSAMEVLRKHRKIPVDRYANNNDIVPLIPPGFVPWQPTRIYGHFGEFRYFDSSGKLCKTTFPGQRIPDRLWGFVWSLLTTGPDAVSDHFMEFYVANLQQAVEKEKKALKLKQSLDAKLGKEQ